MFRPAALIGIYDHGETIAAVVDPLRVLGLPCRLVDDGSGPPTKRRLAELVERHKDVVVWSLANNSGRGAALMHGFERVAAEGFTHAVVLDADAQHDTRDVPRFLEAARACPSGLVLGSPRFGSDAPLGRVLGRKLSRFWVRVETLSMAIEDPLCGFRCYPLRETLAAIAKRRCGTRMDFDPEIAVRLAWRGTPVVNVSTRVCYPLGGLSHFHMIRDNARISWMHTRLVAEMMIRLPQILAVRRRPARDLQSERGP
jgi:glycosyltransferase involved in cell wall biosynthesis